MILLSKAQVVLNSSSKTVFDYVTNMEKYAEWFPGVISIKSKNSLPHARPGKTYLELLRFPSGEHELTIEVIEAEQGRMLLTHGDLDDILPQMTINVEDSHAPNEDGCHLSLQYHSRNTALTEDSEIIKALKHDLAIRAKKGLTNLKEKFLLDRPI